MIDIYIDLAGLPDGLRQYPAFPISCKTQSYHRRPAPFDATFSCQSFPSNYGLPFARTYASLGALSDWRRYGVSDQTPTSRRWDGCQNKIKLKQAWTHVRYNVGRFRYLPGLS
jgi:hypothetical protein